jgi:hypothetical protein
MKTKNLRRYFSALHLYLGLVLGVAFTLLGLTGSFLVFYPEIDQLINPELQINQPKSNEIKVQCFFDQLHVQFTQPYKSGSIEIINAHGELLNRKLLKGFESMEFPIENLSAGVYFIRLNLDGKCSRKVFVKIPY